MGTIGWTDGVFSLETITMQCLVLCYFHISPHHSSVQYPGQGFACGDP